MDFRPKSNGKVFKIRLQIKILFFDRVMSLGLRSFRAHVLKNLWDLDLLTKNWVSDENFKFVVILKGGPGLATLILLCDKRQCDNVFRFMRFLQNGVFYTIFSRTVTGDNFLALNTVLDVAIVVAWAQPCQGLTKESVLNPKPESTPCMHFRLVQSPGFDENASLGETWGFEKFVFAELIARLV